MLSLVITENPPALIDGVPDYFVSDEDFNLLLTDERKAKELYSYLGRDICIGRLGLLEDDVYNEKDYKVNEFNLDSSGKGMSFYEKVL